MTRIEKADVYAAPADEYDWDCSAHTFEENAAEIARLQLINKMLETVGTPLESLSWLCNNPTDENETGTD